MTQQKKFAVLIIEDDTFLHELSKKKFIQQGYEVISAFNGEEGKRKIQQKFPDIILLDLLLPEMDGLDLLKELKENRATQHIPVVIVSNYSDRERVQKGLALGASDYIIKAHFTPDEIVQKVNTLLKKS
ncbi:MAG: hypothetical protein A3B74_02040 [Candidatus Kerfeldbacteria bacterium RIFCSPHIGHO2_02_FULL_42_14]|uniref:Response regulatory domain-containing protein n=1 Tax=Candidatus Kerfeldbacteria bacterium RIFCSPHIGHO2_02_FULL_42_14 TaxID=1798540 RepID=A0A1G2AR40_9BACT|nr:MAG: hypothetical protein A3B74_02040 [Candidatus Kerfeldbacteria bacterium RIFCSPHIGHO2_02_FULL_42_14]OGY81799.1 MAG: hypothetical protein A3E60_00615 [Candidatus Kerfeldbacteria bacterium RIFCSPHIGHO2_12_FULL_42_13]OGY84488.1 MAG: hypothetical protein A3I91_00230 [Candidatus Kerfeldbacteria bacterium RIFCSPLOWO2_02_FULL_42_19]OGY87972.1 MAG: hypothetical protein A3G01_04100 [Candidatus Kerfeldbacteria bacterium RIFCSPLOWO2_12_FULL_43_9]